MVLLIVIAIALLLVAACVLVHYEVLRFTSELIPRLSISTRSKVLVVIAGVFGAHVVEICLFAAGYALMDDYPALGTIGGQFAGTGLDFF